MNKADSLTPEQVVRRYHGEGLDGTPCSGVRFIDRFTVRDSRLVDQQVWNDMGEHPRGGSK